MAEMMTGQTIGKVHLGKLLGEGAAGVVYHGYHTTLGIEVAVKILKINRADREDHVYQERFRREAQLAARLEHPGLVRVLDFGDHNGQPYLVMNYVDGYSLAHYLKLRKTAIDERTVVKVLYAAASALAVAHDAGIVHRDLKPANLLISKKGQLKITDLGLAREDGMANLTMDQVTVGTPAYISPECLMPGGRADQRSDIYSLGVVAYRMAFGKKPYSGSLQQMIHGHLGGRARFDEASECSPETVAMIKKMMAAEPQNRFQSCNELVEHIRNVVNPRIIDVKPKTRNGTDGSSNSMSRPSDFRGIVGFLDGRLGESSSMREGGKVMHTTRNERQMVWALLAGVVLVAGTGYLFFN